jgi:hypothetical protein
MPHFTCPSCNLRLYTAAVRLRREECPRCGARFERAGGGGEPQAAQSVQAGKPAARPEHSPSQPVPRA